MTAAMRLMAAKSTEAAIEAGRLFVAPAQNLMLADADGIGLQTVGAVPLRDARHSTQGRMPAPGWQGNNRWLGVEPYASNRVGGALIVVDPASHRTSGALLVR
mgnify:CR=1 FL=1